MPTKVPTIKGPGITGKPFYRVLKIVILNVNRYSETNKSGYQRPILEPWVSYLVNHWDDVAYGAIYVAQRPDGSYWIVDGQQRTEAAKRLGMTEVRCLVIPTDGTLRPESDMFFNFNKKKPPTPFDIYVSQLFIGEPAYVTVDRAAGKLGYKVLNKGGNMPKTATCIKRMLEWAKRDSEIFEKGMAVAAKMLRGETMNNRVLVGLCALEEYLVSLGGKESILDEKNLKKLMIAGRVGFDTCLAVHAKYKGNNSTRAQANACLDIINEDRAASVEIPIIRK